MAHLALALWSILSGSLGAGAMTSPFSAAVVIKPRSTIGNLVTFFVALWHGRTHTGAERLYA